MGSIFGPLTFWKPPTELKPYLESHLRYSQHNGQQGHREDMVAPTLRFLYSIDVFWTYQPVGIQSLFKGSLPRPIRPHRAQVSLIVSQWPPMAPKKSLLLWVGSLCVGSLFLYENLDQSSFEPGSKLLITGVYRNYRGSPLKGYALRLMMLILHGLTDQGHRN